jgi:hypothetical protein
MTATWHIQGVYADWTLTLTVTPPADGVDDNHLTELPEGRIRAIHQIFNDSVEIAEYEHCLESQIPQGVTVMLAH